MLKLSKKDKALHDEFSKYGKNAKEWMRKCVLMLPRIERNRIWEKKKFGSIYEYAAKITGMSRHKVDDSLRVIRIIEDKPALMEVAKIKGLNAVRPAATVATKETDNFWAKKAGEMSVKTLATFVKDFRDESRDVTGSPACNVLEKPSRQSKYQVSMKLDKEIFLALKSIKKNGDWNQAMKKLLEMSRESFEKEELAEIHLQSALESEKPEKVKSKTHKITVAIKKFITKRSGGKCEHPSCNKPGKHIHHTEPFALKREHDPDKLLHLCEEHHQLIHLGYIDDSSVAKPWSQISGLPEYDIKNVINKRIAEFRRSSIPIAAQKEFINQKQYE